jgi:hypothetical protein
VSTHDVIPHTHAFYIQQAAALYILYILGRAFMCTLLLHLCRIVIGN